MRENATFRPKLGIVGFFALIAFTFCSATANTDPAVTYLFDFTDFKNGSIEEWLEGKGFIFKLDAEDRQKIDLGVAARGLVLEAKTKAHGLLVAERIDLEDYRKIRITWGVNQYPEGADYEAGIRNEPIMVMVFYGHDKVSSGSFLIPDMPYFVGLFLCDKGKVNRSYTGEYFREGGRYVCLDQPEPGTMVTSTFDLHEAFRTYFGEDEVPLISGIALQVDTTSSKNGGTSSAVIAAVEFLANS